MADDDATAEADTGNEAVDAEGEGSEPEGDSAYGVPVTRERGFTILHVTPDQLIETAEAVRADGFVQLLDVCGVDYLDHPGRSNLPVTVAPERFEIVAMAINHERGERIRIRVQVPEADPVVPSLFDVWPGAEISEREAFDMFGIIFADHPDLTRVLMPEDWVGHPLRRDYDVGRIPVQFKGAPTTR